MEREYGFSGNHPIDSEAERAAAEAHSERFTGPHWELVWEELRAHAREQGKDEDAYVREAQEAIASRDGELERLIAASYDKLLHERS